MVMLNCHAKNEFKRSSFSGEISCKRIKQSDRPIKCWGYSIFCYVGLGAKPPISQKMRKSPIRITQTQTTNFHVLSLKVLAPVLLLEIRQSLKTKKSH